LKKELQDKNTIIIEKEKTLEITNLKHAEQIRELRNTVSVCEEDVMSWEKRYDQYRQLNEELVDEKVALYEKNMKLSTTVEALQVSNVVILV
jgi:hypothetical protein